MEQHSNEYDVYLFDWDGLLVSTQELLYLSWRKAYQDLEQRDAFFTFEEWSLQVYSSCHNVPRPWMSESNKVRLSARRHQIYQDMLSSPHLRLMNGVKAFLLSLNPQSVFVVTNSSRSEVERIRHRLNSAVLETIPYSHWFTREMYERRKPYPDGWNRAIDMASREQRKTPTELKVIAFEDTPSGVQSFLASQPTGKKTCVLVSPFPYQDQWHDSTAEVIKIPHF